MSKAGKFEIRVSDPWPQWVRLSIGGEEVKASLRAEDLPDLAHAVKMAIWEANLVRPRINEKDLPL